MEITTGLEVTARGARITTWCALSSKAVVETTLAFVAEAFFGCSTEVTCAVAKITGATGRWASTEAAAIATMVTTTVATVATKATFTGTIAELAVTVAEATAIATTAKAGA